MELYGDVRFYILSFLDPRALTQIARVSKTLKAESENSLLWKQHVEKILKEEVQEFSKDHYKKIYLNNLGNKLLEIIKKRN